MPSRKLVPLVSSDAERTSLEVLARKRAASRVLAEWARIILACAGQGGAMLLTRVAELTGVSRESVRKRRVRFLDGRTGAPCNYSGGRVMPKRLDDDEARWAMQGHSDPLVQYLWRENEALKIRIGSLEERVARLEKTPDSK